MNDLKISQLHNIFSSLSQFTRFFFVIFISFIEENVMRNVLYYTNIIKRRLFFDIKK